MEYCSDDELLYLMRCGNQEAERYLYSRYYRFIRKWIEPYLKFALYGYEFEDYLQSAMMFLPIALDHYRDDQQSSLRTFLKTVIIRRILSVIKINKGYYLYHYYGTVSLDSWVDDEKSTRLEEVVEDPYQRDYPEKVLMIKETEKYYLDKVEQEATDLEMEVANYKREGYDHREIADILNISVKSVYNSLYRYHKKIVGIDERK